MTFTGDQRDFSIKDDYFTVTVAMPKTPRRSDDATLMARVGQGDVEAFAMLVERHSPTIYRVACRMLGACHEAEDIVQECFARLWQGAAHWQPRDSGLVGWLHRVTMNLCLDRKRRFRVIYSEALPEIADGEPLADQTMQAGEVCNAVDQALLALPDRYRAALVLTYYEEHSNALAAEIMELNIKAMESLLVRARRRMRELLEEHGVLRRDLELFV